jgi:large subunit ribosomal protein L20
MARTKGGYVTRRSHKKILEMTKGQWGSKSRLFRRANEAMMQSQWYAYRDRRQRRRQLRVLWIARIGAGARINNTSYSQLIGGLKRAGIELDRKILSDIATHDPATFSAIVKASGAVRA